MWPWSGRRQQGPQTTGRLTSGIQRSPGLALVHELLDEASSCTLLDLGRASKENLDALSRLADDLVIQDCFHSTRAPRGQRAEVFRFGAAADVDLPDRKQAFDLILLWDLLHYFEPAEARRFAGRLVERLAPGGLMLVHASAIAPIPPTPIEFRLAGPDRLDYQLDEERVPAPGLHTRTIERWLRPCEPLRVFQLRNGLREQVLRRPAATATTADGGA